MSGKPESAAIDTWFRDDRDEEGMIEDHAYLWERLIRSAGEQDYRHKTILDYGCNRGGFLQALYRDRPFHKGIGVDVAELSLAVARKRHRALPIDFMTPDAMHRYAGTVDIAFSHEVLYLLPDLNEHARAIAEVLKSDGEYFAAIGCHTGNPQWAHWRTLIRSSTCLPVFDYSLDEYAVALWKAGFRVDMRPFQMDDFILIKPDNAYFPSASDSLNYHTHVKTIIRATRREGGA